MKIYTRTGDDGSTSLRGGRRVPKHHQKIEAYGTVDELISWLGLLRCYIGNKKNNDFLIYIQKQLMACAAALATDRETGAQKIVLPDNDCVEKVEKEIDRLDMELQPLSSFILPGGDIASSHCNIARCVCRRAEREVLRLTQNETVPEIIIRFLNRISDYLFILSRYQCKEAGNEEIKWII